MALPQPGPVAVRAATDMQKNAYVPSTGAGVREDGPPYQNRGTPIDIYDTAAGIPLGSPWCAAAVYYRLIMAAHWLEKHLPADLLPDNGFAAGAADSYAAWAERHGVWIPVREAASGAVNPASGDLVCFDLVREGGIHHVGFVLSAGTSGGVTVEGNTHEDGDVARDGYCIAVHRRSWSDVGPHGGFVRLAF